MTVRYSLKHFMYSLYQVVTIFYFYLFLFRKVCIQTQHFFWLVHPVLFHANVPENGIASWILELPFSHWDSNHDLILPELLEKNLNNQLTISIDLQWSIDDDRRLSVIERNIQNSVSRNILKFFKEDDVFIENKNDTHFL